MEPDRFDYLPITHRPKIQWPNNARVAFWLAPNVEYYEYLPPPPKVKPPAARTPYPDVRRYGYNDYANRVGFWRMLEVVDKHEMRCTASLNEANLEHHPEVRDAMVARNWDYMSHGIYNTRPLYGTPPEEERAFLQDCIETLRKQTGKQLKGMLGPAATNTANTDDLMAEAGLIYHVDWFHDDQPFPIKVKKGKLISVPYTIDTNDANMFVRGYEADYFCQIIKDQFDGLYKEGAENGRVMCVAIHPFWIGQPHRVKYLDEALSYILSHEGVWKTTGDEIADYYMTHYYDKVVAYTAEWQAQWQKKAGA